jgi:hypothetical protein
VLRRRTAEAEKVLECGSCGARGFPTPLCRLLARRFVIRLRPFGLDEHANKAEQLVNVLFETINPIGHIQQPANIADEIRMSVGGGGRGKRFA